MQQIYEATAYGRREPSNMSPQWPTTDGVTKRERFSAGWTGAVAVGLFVYIALAIVLILVDGRAWPWLDVFNLYSDSIASIGVAILTGAAARGSADPGARRTWWLLTAALATYSTGNLCLLYTSPSPRD